MAKSEPNRLQTYLSFVQAHSEEFSSPPGGIRIALKEDEIIEIEGVVGNRYARKGWPAEWAEVGILYRDPYLVLIRDAVIFPGGRVAIHHRVSYGGNPSGAAVIPLLGDRIVLVRQFRHPSRSWHWEIPRGGVEVGQSPEQAAFSELSEEIGAEICGLVPLGLLHGSNSLISTPVALFLGRIEKFGAPQREEGIVSVSAFNVSEVEGMLLSGKITDSFTHGAFLHARLRGLI